MADDATRRLLRVFGIAVTDCEDALDELEAAVGASREGLDAARAVGAYAKAARELAAGGNPAAPVLAVAIILGLLLILVLELIGRRVVSRPPTP